MGGLTAQNRIYRSCKMPHKVLKCIIELEIQAVTCPGVVLTDQEDIYLSVCIMGKYQKTKCLPPIFPLLFHEKLNFEKVFADAVDPGDIAELLELDTTSFELIQLVPPVGETLATLVENTREFLYPGPRLTPRYPGSEREMLMKRSISFPGIAPKVEFSTVSVIKECDLKETMQTPSPCRSTPLKPRSGRGIKKSPCSADQQSPSVCRYKQPTVASQSRSPSPYTNRRMCELSEEASQRLSHLNLGPYRFKKETDSQPPFVVSSKQTSSMNDSLSYRTPSTKKSLRTPGLNVCEDPSLLGSYRPKTTRVIAEPQEGYRLRPSRGMSEDTSLETAGICRRPRRQLKAHSTPLSTVKSPPSPLLNRSSLRERFQTSPSTPTHWEEIHERVQKILKTHRSRHGMTPVWGSLTDSVHQKTSTSCNDSLCDSQVQEDSSRGLGEATVHLDNGTFWSNQAAQYTGKPHRAVFEDSLGKIYRNLFKKASSTT
ncbi:spermatogenesis-associated protein 6 isoform X2 [Lepisosteus oculatus]|uniref:spermatogenesis-associated protein 6 isoform X2 n=1 Tax=Lepisosteus oculatus TaxID=7918 RepID=UPI0007404DC2|nr:PREDICTED: spermatogenesis-associated protein 6 isoform X2 [Lepisosteus oculatus]